MQPHLPVHDMAQDGQNVMVGSDMNPPNPQVLKLVSVVPQRPWAGRSGRNIRPASNATAIHFIMADGSYLLARKALKHDHAELVCPNDEMPFVGTSAKLRFEVPS